MPRLMAAMTLCVAVTAAVQVRAAEDSLHPRVKLETSLGDIVLELDAEKAPLTTVNFVRYVEDKYYDGTIFHRVIENFMIQGGGFTTSAKKSEGLRKGVKNEWRNGLKNVRGSISMARLGGQPDSGTSQFFINVVDNVSLDRPRDGAAYAVFGKVVEGMDVVDKIRAVEVTAHPTISGGKVPVSPVIIKAATLASPFSKVKALESTKAKMEAAGSSVEAQFNSAVARFEKETGKQAMKTPSGMAYIVLREGSGPKPSPTDRVEVHYTGWLLDGSKFDSSVDRGQPATFGLNQVIKGWTEGVGLMKEGAKYKLIIPPELAYGKAGRPSIPPDSVLVFDVELLSIK